MYPYALYMFTHTSHVFTQDPVWFSLLTLWYACAADGHGDSGGGYGPVGDIPMGDAGRCLEFRGGEQVGCCGNGGQETGAWIAAARSQGGVF